MEESVRPEMVLQPLLGSGERLLWGSQPARGLRVRPADAVMIPFSLLWGGFACVWEVLVVTMRAPIFFMLWGIPFVLVGLYMMVGRFLVDARQRERTYYGLTDQRVLIVTGRRGRAVRSWELRALGDLSLRQRPDGSGSILFGVGQVVVGLPGWTGAWPGVRTTPGFEMIERARQVYDQIRAAQQDAVRTHGSTT